ncbi:MAG TPA: hypothetical protein VGE43_11015, partial [Acidimicrobiales bacterium]
MLVEPRLRHRRRGPVDVGQLGERALVPSGRLQRAVRHLGRALRITACTFRADHTGRICTDGTDPQNRT